MDRLIREYPYFNRSGGRDHVYTFAQGFGARHAGDWRRIRNGIFLVHNGEWTADEFTTHKDVVLPPDLTHYLLPVYVQPSRGMDGSTGGGSASEGVASRTATAGVPVPKTHFLLFGGQVLSANVSDARGSNYSGGVRQYVMEHLAQLPGYRLTGVRSRTYLADLAASRFCLCPEGWHPWSPR
eukprot:contig_29979_g7343